MSHEGQAGRDLQPPRRLPDHDLGAYRITTPAGSYDAALIRWTYQGKVGPAKIDDTQYRFFAEGVGMVASVDKLDISALLVYQDHSKFGKLLARMPVIEQQT